MKGCGKRDKDFLQLQPPEGLHGSLQKTLSVSAWSVLLDLGQKFPAQMG